MKNDEIQTSEIREPQPGFDRRARTVRGRATDFCSAGYRPDVSVGGVSYAGLEGYAAGEDLNAWDLVELENGLWWRCS